jgi:uncharacterized Rmd1/YagE family protein
VVFFNYDESDEAKFIKLLQQFEEDRLNEKEREVGSEDLQISFAGKEAGNIGI